MVKGEKKRNRLNGISNSVNKVLSLLNGIDGGAPGTESDK